MSDKIEITGEELSEAIAAAVYGFASVAYGKDLTVDQVKAVHKATLDTIQVCTLENTVDTFCKVYQAKTETWRP